MWCSSFHIIKLWLLAGMVLLGNDRVGRSYRSSLLKVPTFYGVFNLRLRAWASTTLWPLTICVYWGRVYKRVVPTSLTSHSTTPPPDRPTGQGTYLYVPSSKFLRTSSLSEGNIFSFPWSSSLTAAPVMEASVSSGSKWSELVLIVMQAHSLLSSPL